MLLSMYVPKAKPLQKTFFHLFSKINTKVLSHVVTRSKVIHKYFVSIQKTLDPYAWIHTCIQYTCQTHNSQAFSLYHTTTRVWLMTAPATILRCVSKYREEVWVLKVFFPCENCFKKPYHLQVPISDNSSFSSVKDSFQIIGER